MAKEPKDLGVKVPEGAYDFDRNGPDDVDDAALDLIWDEIGEKELTDNVFCPTGPGGGKDPTCSSGGGGGNSGGNLSVKIDALPELSKTDPAYVSGRAQVPFPVDKDVPYPGQWVEDAPGRKGFLDVGGRKITPPVGDVPLEGLNATQSWVTRSQLHAIADKSLGKPLIIEQGGTRWIYDGTHRATIAKLRGDRTIKAFVHRMPSNDG